MKNIISIIFIVIISFSSTLLFGQKESNIKTESFKVSGMCDMCKKRIEDAAYIKGVKRAEWIHDTELLTVTFNTKKTSKEKIVQSVVVAGHDADGIKAEDEVVEKLPACCNFRDPNNPHIH